jgi:hypothetical protein
VIFIFDSARYAEELNARIQQDAEATKKFAEALDRKKEHEVWKEIAPHSHPVR